jgi:hypothetical protein
MNDPHVETLFYRLKHPANAYAKVSLLEHQESTFKVRIENGQAQVDMTNHFPTVQDARATVERFLRAWELTAALQYGPGEFEFVYDRAEVIDRNPAPGIVSGVGALLAGSGALSADGHGVRANYPAPPVGIARDAEVDLMFHRYCMYREGRTTLPDAANYCLTMVERSAGDRKAASKQYAIALTVLNTLGQLAATKGGTEARKACASDADFTSAERRWLANIIAAIIRRAAEVAFDPAASRPQITMADLPPLADR